MQKAPWIEFKDADSLEFPDCLTRHRWGQGDRIFHETGAGLGDRSPVGNFLLPSLQNVGQGLVTVATGAFGPLLVKLRAFQRDEYKLLEEGTRSDVEFIKSELEPVHAVLLRLTAQWEGLDTTCKDWMLEVQELSFDIEDSIDNFLLNLESRSSGFIQRTTDSPFDEFKTRVKDVSQRCREMQTTGEAITNSNHIRPAIDPRVRFLHKDASELVGMDKPKEELIQLLQNHRTVCILGSAGSGKTALADQFRCRALVSVSTRPNLVEILSCILRQITNATTAGTEGNTEEYLIRDISNFLAENRYLVMVDDIWHWEEWEIIRKALPNNRLGSKIITTTRINAIAERYGTDKDACIYKIGDIDTSALADMIVMNSTGVLGTAPNSALNYLKVMCRGMPQALVCLLSALAESLENGHYAGWDTWERYVHDGFLNIPSLKPLVETLCLGYDDLPIHLRTCLLYCIIYPEDYKIERHPLVSKWIAEGFADGEEAAEGYFDELVTRNLLHSAEGIKYEVHPVMLAFLECKSKEANFVNFRSYEHDSSSLYTARIRRLSLHHQVSLDFSGMDVSHTRSLFVFNYELGFLPLRELKLLRVLDLENSRGLDNTDLVDVFGLIWLRYLGLKGCCNILMLPPQIEKLQSLETLDIESTGMRELPREIGKLQHLKILNLSNTAVRQLPREIWEMQHLKTLNVSNTMVKELPWENRLFSNSVVVLVGNKDSPKAVKFSTGVLAVWQQASEELVKHRTDLSIILADHFDGLPPVIGIKVLSRHMRIPPWVKEHLINESSLDIRLCKLDIDDLKFLQEMPNLQVLTLRLEVPPKKPIVITGGGFTRLESLCIDCRLPPVIFKQVAMLNRNAHDTFKKEAKQNLQHLETFNNEDMPNQEHLETSEQEVMPNLKHLGFKFYVGRASGNDPVGIKHLRNLRRVVFQSSPWYESDVPGISHIINKVRKEAEEHTNRITICVNDENPIVFPEATKISDLGAASSGACEMKAIVEKRERLLRAALMRAAAGQGKFEEIEEAHDE